VTGLISSRTVMLTLLISVRSDFSGCIVTIQRTQAVRLTGKDNFFKGDYDD